MSELRLLMVVQSPEMARFVTANGVDRLFVDLEHIGKAERQKHLDSWKSGQVPSDVSRMREAVPDAHIVVRINPLNEGSSAEIDDVIARGADAIMLPMFRTREELDEFFDLVGDRVATLPLFETAASIKMLPDLVGHPMLRDVHIGLNDLHLDLGMTFIFEPIANGLLEEACAALGQAGIPFGIGGIARAKEGIVPPDRLLGEHVRLGSTSAILSQSFHRNAQSLEELVENTNFAAEIDALRGIFKAFLDASPDELDENRRLTNDRIRDVVHLIQNRQNK